MIWNGLNLTLPSWATADDRAVEVVEVWSDEDAIEWLEDSRVTPPGLVRRGACAEVTDQRALVGFIESKLTDDEWDTLHTERRNAAIDMAAQEQEELMMERMRR